MNYISNVLYQNFKKSACSFIPFITAGYPSIDLTLQTLYILDKEGADLIELGIPYSDALADGPLIQEASKVAIKNGVNIDKIIEILDEIYLKINTPIIIFTYYNPILVKGIKNFIAQISQFGVKGLVIPDLPLEESDYLISICQLYQIELILFISPTSSSERISDILDKSPGCIYLVSSTGVTGMRDSIDKNIDYISSELILNSSKMLMLGFGISNPDQIKHIIQSKPNINGIVVGSAFTKILSNYLIDSKMLLMDSIRSFCRKMKSATLS
uniref:Tryptophan synthase alpha chain n=1 Tax=Vertebrata australis TaxID=1967852 RepID=A0A1Z1MI39_9FLOR|nr:Tryptophan synthase alpha subunit [Vertebrata australis]ARW65738.1 Tryptophan synthase alpha subunit [Vertebrata australis]